MYVCPPRAIEEEEEEECHEQRRVMPLDSIRRIQHRLSGAKMNIIWHFLFVLPSELIGGTPSLKMNHGSGTLVLQLNNNIGVADRRWHRLDVRSNSKVKKTSIAHAFIVFRKNTI